MRPTTINAEQFQKRLVVLCLRQRLTGLPKKMTDLHILLKAAALSMTPQELYDERAFNDVIVGWLERLGGKIVTDHVTLRRALIDHGYVERDAAGRQYRVRDASAHRELFGPDVDHLDVFEVIREAKADIAARRARFAR